MPPRRHSPSAPLLSYAAPSSDPWPLPVQLLGTDSSASYILTEATSKEEADAQLNRTFRKLAKERLPHSIMLHTQGMCRP